MAFWRTNEDSRLDTRREVSQSDTASSRRHRLGPGRPSSGPATTFGVLRGGYPAAGLEGPASVAPPILVP